MKQVDNDFGRYLSGANLYGDDFSSNEIEQWFADEKNAYAELGAGDKEAYHYDYHALNWQCAFRYLAKRRRYSRACGFGSAYGHELLPIIGLIDAVTIIDSSTAFAGGLIGGTAPNFIQARNSGDIAAENQAFDLMVCLGVLHHIPNVSYVVSEFHRTLVSGGMLVVREPTTSMGDWRKPRPGVTARERGIPKGVFEEILTKSGFVIERRTPCVFAPLSALCGRLGLSCYSSRPLVRIDLGLSRLFNWNYSYHRTSVGSKFAPASEFYVCHKL